MITKNEFMNKRKTLYFIYFISAIITSSCGLSNKAAESIVSMSTPQKNEYPADVVQNFMNTCQKGGSSQSACACMLSKIQVKYTIDELSVLEVKLKSGQAPEDFMDFMGEIRINCRSKKIRNKDIKYKL